MNRLKKLAGLLKEDSSSSNVEDAMKKSSDTIFDAFHDLQAQSKKLVGKDVASAVYEMQAIFGRGTEHGASRLDFSALGYDSEEEMYEYLDNAGAVKKTEVSITTDKWAGDTEIEVIVRLYTAKMDVIEIKFGEFRISW